MPMLATLPAWVVPLMTGITTAASAAGFSLQAARGSPDMPDSPLLSPGNQNLNGLPPAPGADLGTLTTALDALQSQQPQQQQPQGLQNVLSDLSFSV